MSYHWNAHVISTGTENTNEGLGENLALLSYVKV